MSEQIKYKNQIIAIIIRKNFHKDGIDFFSPKEFSQQLGYMQRPKGYKIAPHIHLLNKRNILYTQETLIVKKGMIKINFYNNEQQFIKDCLVSAGDIILLANAGHGVEFLKKSELIEIKQGPYNEKSDKIRF
jgi:hypothetical protein